MSSRSFGISSYTLSIGIVSLVRLSLRATSIVLFSRSRGPIARRTGTPFNSYSANFHPGLLLSLSSYLTDIPKDSNPAFILTAASDNAPICSTFLYIGIITTCMGASFGAAQVHYYRRAP